MPTWLILVIGLVALPFALWFLEEVVGYSDVAEDFGKAAAILFGLAVVAASALGIIDLVTGATT